MSRKISWLWSKLILWYQVEMEKKIKYVQSWFVNSWPWPQIDFMVSSRNAKEKIECRGKSVDFDPDWFYDIMLKY